MPVIIGSRRGGASPPLVADLPPSRATRASASFAAAFGGGGKVRLYAVLICGCVAAWACRGGTSQPPGYRPVATVDEVMDAIVIPSSEAIFDAVVYENGELVQAPTVDDDWFRLRMHAMAVAESGNLLMMPPRAKDNGEWITFSRALLDAAIEVASAAESKDVERFLQTGSEMYRACAGCHSKYVPMQ